MITHAILSGVDTLQIAQLFLNLMMKKSVVDYPFLPKFLDYLPRRPRKDIPLPDKINDFIFPEGIKLIQEVQDQQKAPDFKMTPRIVSQ